MPTREPKKRPNIYKRGRRYWIYYTSGGKRHFEPVRDKSRGIDGTRLEDAIRLLNERQGEIAKGVPVSPGIGRTLFADALKDVIDDQRRNERRAIRDAERRIELHIGPYFAARRISDVTTPVVRHYVTTRQAEGATNAGINRELAIIRRAFRLAHRAGHVLTIPHIEFLDESRNVRQGFVEPEQFAQIERHLAPKVYADVARFAFITGWRVPSEVLSLTWSQVDLPRQLIRVDPGTTKGGEGRTFPITAQLREVLTRRERERREGCDLVFHEQEKPIHRRKYHTAWAKAREAAKLPTLIPHDLRRSAVRQMERARVPRQVAMRLVGHRTESIYRRYAIVSEDDVQAARASLDALHTAARSVTKSLHSTKRPATRRRGLPQNLK